MESSSIMLSTCARFQFCFSSQLTLTMKTTILTLVCLFVICAGQGGPSIPTPGAGAAWMQRHNGFVSNTAANPGIPILFYGDR